MKNVFDTTCNLMIDFGEGITPQKEDILLSNGGSAYRVLKPTKVRSRNHTNRWKLYCLRIDPSSIAEGTRICSFTWYSRNK